MKRTSQSPRRYPHPNSAEHPWTYNPRNRDSKNHNLRGGCPLPQGRHPVLLARS